MGTYDTLEIPTTPGDGAQIKLFGCDMKTFKVGDQMPRPGNYAIALREGGYAGVTDGRLTGWQRDAPSDRSIYDKWGDNWEGDKFNVGLLGEHYFYV